VPQVGPDGIGLAVDQLGAQLELVERLVPELPLRLRPQDPVADPRQRRGDHEGADQIGPGGGDGLGDPAADVVSGDDRPGDAELPDQRDEAAGLSGGGVLAGRLGRVPVGLAEPAQVRRDHLDHLVSVYGPPGAFTASIAWYRAGAGSVAASLAEQVPDPDRRIAVPTTVLWPSHDPLFPREWSDRIGDFFAAATLRPLDGVGHFTPLESPRDFAAGIIAAAGVSSG